MNISFVNDDDSVEFPDQIRNSVYRIAGRIVRRTNEKHFRFGIDRFFNRGKVELKIFCQIDAPDRRVVDFCRNPIHSVSRRKNQNIVFTRAAKNTKQKIDRLVAAAADKDFAFSDVSPAGNDSLDFNLQRIGITIVVFLERRSETVFIGVEKNPRRAAEFRAGGRIRREAFDVFTN